MDKINYRNQTQGTKNNEIINNNNYQNNKNQNNAYNSYNNFNSQNNIKNNSNYVKSKHEDMDIITEKHSTYQLTNCYSFLKQNNNKYQDEKQNKCKKIRYFNENNERCIVF